MFLINCYWGVKRLYLYIKQILKSKIGFIALIFFVLFLSLSLFSSDFEKKYNLKSQKKTIKDVLDAFKELTGMNRKTF